MLLLHSLAAYFCKRGKDFLYTGKKMVVTSYRLTLFGFPVWKNSCLGRYFQKTRQITFLPFLVNLFEFLKLLIVWFSWVNQSEVSKIQKSLPKKSIIWFFLNKPHIRFSNMALFKIKKKIIICSLSVPHDLFWPDLPKYLAKISQRTGRTSQNNLWYCH